MELEKEKLELIKKQKKKLSDFRENLKWVCLPNDIERILLKNIDEKLEELTFYEDELTKDLCLIKY